MSRKIKVSAAIFCGIFCLAFIVGNVFQVKAESPSMSSINLSLSSVNSVYLSWTTDVATTAKIDYGKTAGQYTDSKIISELKTKFGESISGLDYETTYYFKITVTDSQNNSESSDELSIATSSKELTFVSIEPKSIGYDKVVIEVETNKAAWADCQYGSSADNLDKTCGQLDLLAGAGGGINLFKTLKDLEPETTYYYQITSSRFSNWYHGQPDESITSEVKSVTTSGITVIDSISPESGAIGTEITINGQNFGNENDLDWIRRSVAIGCTGDLWPSYSDCGIDITSWNDTQIKAKVTGKAKTGPVYTGKSVERGLEALMFSVKGPIFTVTSGEAPAIAASYVGEAYGCKFSTSLKSENTVQVRNLFTEGGETDTYFNNVYQAYYNAWSRYPRCDELQFHYDHSTDLETLRNWLANYSITEKYGCKYSTAVSDESTVKLDSLFILDSEMDKYLNDVYTAYYEAWGRYPRCDELEFHATHNTSLSRLNAWLQENKPSAEEISEVSDMEMSDLKGNHMVFKDSGAKVMLKNAGQDLTFESKERITFSGVTDPDSTIVLAVSSELSVYTTTSDSEGNWAYTLPGPLEAGNHTVKVSVLDENGDIVGESDEISFTVGTVAEAASESSAELSTQDKAIIFGAIIIALILIIVLVSKKNKKKE